MRKIITACIMISFWAIAGVASATTWTDIYNPTDIKLGAGDSIDFIHNITDEGFNIGKDLVTSANLIVDLDNDCFKSKLTITLPVQDGDYGKEFTYDDRLLNISLTGLTQLNDSGELWVTLLCTKGSFNFDQSTLVANGTGSTLVPNSTEFQPVPEPGTLVMLGAGLFSLVVFFRRRATA